MSKRVSNKRGKPFRAARHRKQYTKHSDENYLRLRRLRRLLGRMRLS